MWDLFIGVMTLFALYGLIKGVESTYSTIQATAKNVEEIKRLLLVTTASFSLATCAKCGRLASLVEGDIIKDGSGVRPMLCRECFAGLLDSNGKTGLDGEDVL